MNTYDAILSRQSVRKFRADQIPPDLLRKILLAGNCAPVGRGQDKSIFLSVIQDPGVLDRIKCAARDKFKLPDALYAAPVLVVVSSCKDAMFENIEYANAACIVENMMLAATDLGLGSVYIWGAVTAIRDDAELCAALGIPDGFYPVSAAALGYTDVPPKDQAPQLKFSYRMI